MRVQHFGLAALATCFLVQSVHAWNSVGYYTHEALAHDGLYSLPTNDYPDLIKFEAALKDGSESEAGHPGGAFSDEIGGDVAAIWTGNSDLLPGGVLKNFSEKSFVEAYTNIGRIVHLTQDQAVPAHAANIAHSWLHWDDFETYADDHYLVHRINGYSYAFPQQYYAPQQNDTRGKLAGWRKPSTNEQYWVPGADMTVRGHYGGPDGEDIYYNGTYPAIWGVESPEIVGTQNWQGVRNTAGVFAAASRKLPPLIKDLAHTTVSPTIQNPMSIMFGAMENRTQTVRLTAKILKSDGVDTNKKAFDAHPIQLDPGTYLPWEKQVSVQWNGTPTDGSILDYGEYTLELFLADADENESPHASIGFRLVKPGTPSLTIHDNDGGESQSDPFYGDANTPETAPWLHNDFSVDPISGITFVAENDDGLRWFYLGTSDLNPATAFLNTELDLRHLVVETRILPDKEGYAVAAWGATDERTKVNFGVDSLPPELAFNVHVKPDFTVWLKGEVKDKTSGVAEIRYAQIQGVPQKYDELPGTGSPMSRLIDQEVVPAQQNEWGRYAFLHVSAGDRAGLASTGSVVSYYSSRSGNVSWNVNKETSPEWFSFPSGGFGNRLFGARRESACVRRSGSLPEQCNADPPPPSSCGSLAFRVKTESSPDPGEPKPGAIEIISEVPSSETTIFDAALGVDDRTVDLELPLGPAVWFQLALTDANSNPCYEPTATVGIDLETMSGTAETNPAQGPLPSGTDIAVTADGATFELARVEPGPNNHFMVLRDDDPVPPVGYKRLCGVNPARDFTTGAIYSGSLTATFLIDAPCLTQSQFSRIRMFHMVAGSWTDITSSVNVANRTVQGVDDHASWFGVFISTSILFNDAHAPTSQITYSTYPMTPASGGIWISTDTLLTLTAADPVIEGEASSGVEGLYYLLDQQFISRAETPGTRYEAPFTLEGGTRTLTFYAADGAGNVESAHRLDLVSYEHASQLPGSLWVSARSSTAVELSWQQNGNPPNAGYGLAYGSTGGSMSCDLDSGVFTQNQPSIRPALRIGGLLPMTPYAFSICALGIQGNCGASVVVQTSPAEQVGDEPSPSFVACGTGGGPSGLALSADSTGNLWEIVSDDSSIRLGKFDAAGAQVASVNLPGANEEGRWTIRFDPEGNAYAVGGASSGAEEGLQRVAVYKVASSGDVLLSSTVFENPWGLNDFAFDSTGDIWITGAVQTSGPPDFSGPVGIAMGLWRFEPATGQLSLKASYAGDSGFDAGFGVQLDGSGAIWVVGFSSMAASTSPNKLALALWKYDATGTNLLAGPFLRHGYMRDIEQDVNARLLASGDDLWVTATKTSAVGNLDLALVRYGLDGALKSEKFWHSDSGGDELPTSILVGRNGAITVAGGTGAGANELAVWRHTSEGVLEWASTMAGAGRANGMVYSGGMWLAAAGAGTPLKFTPGASLAGGEGTDAGGLDVLAPRTTVQIGEPKTPGDPVTVSTA
ncbi:MAG: hypothetical protein HY924_06350, partial [Elusimicrobia bacterium]|nr:hypothetical protein [Elusimicrobiota bacterium]